MEGDAPDTSKWLEWDWRPIGLSTLVELLALERDPDTMRPIDWRRRYSDFTHATAQLPLFNLVEEPA
jgi:hypothetical protein